MAEYDERIRRLHPVPNRSELEQLSPEELAQAMEQALDDMTEDTYDQAVIDAYLDALDAKAPMPEAPDVEESYQQFQEMLTQALPAEKSPRPRRRGRVLRMTLRVTLAAVFLFGCLVAAQASGVDVFGAVARWTEDTFWMDLPSTPPTRLWYKRFLDQLATVDLTAKDLPTWLPNGYWVGPTIKVTHGSSTGIAPFDSAFINFEGPDLKNQITLSILTHLDTDEMEFLSMEKDDTPVSVYKVNDKTVYFFSDGKDAKAVCQYGDVFYFLEGAVTEDMIEPFFGSIGQAP